ncbi:MAG: hypothetical protein AAF721_32815 [Myxococcota bacterium]
MVRTKLGALVLVLLVGCGADPDATTGSTTSGAATESQGEADDDGTDDDDDDDDDGDSSDDGGTDGGTDGGMDTDDGTDTDDGGTDDDDTGDSGDDGVDAEGWYPGIPYPTDDLPGGIMPTLPTPGAQPGWPYDPIELELPEPTDAANEYVISVAGSDQGAGNGGNGTMAAPRRTIPLGALPASAKLFIIGANSEYGTVDFDIGDDDSWQCVGTEGDPCFVVGIDGPRIGRRVAVQGSSHFVIDGVSMVDNGDGRPWGSMNVVDSSYITVRNVEIRGNGQNSSGGSAMSLSNVEFMMAYRMTFHEIGSWETNATDLDVHAWRPAYGNRYLWLIDSELFHIQADGVQSGNSNYQGPQSEVSHYIYIAGNEFYENYENAIDNKNSYHVVMSSNEIHDFYAGQGASGANGTAVIVSNNSEGPWTGYHWAVNNQIWNTSLALRDSGSESDERNFMVGNVIWNANTAILMANNGPNRESWVVNNTAFGASTAFDVGQPGSNASVFLHGNILHGGSLDTATQMTSELRDNILFDAQLDGQWDIDTGNLSEDPALVDPTAGDMSVAAGSAAVDGMSEPSEVYEIFDGLYGLDLREDLNGTPRPSGAAWDIGAVEAP